MKKNSPRGLAAVIRYLPEVFAVQPITDYRAFAPKSGNSVMQEAWSRTCNQMVDAFVATTHKKAQLQKYVTSSEYSDPAACKVLTDQWL